MISYFIDLIREEDTDEDNVFLPNMEKMDDVIKGY
jgi:hypothetical protein